MSLFRPFVPGVCFLLLLLSPVPGHADGMVGGDSMDGVIEYVPPPGKAKTQSSRDKAPLWDYKNRKLQRRLEKAIKALGLWKASRSGSLAVALVDITNLHRPRVASLNGDRMMYAASLPKIAILLAVFEKIADGDLRLDHETEQQLLRMIRRSNNRDSTALIHKVGKPYLNKVLSSDRYKLYNPKRNGGLWVGKDYGKHGLWKRDPLHNLSHGATAMQVARFYYLLETGELVSSGASRKMKEILGHSAITHKFIRGLQFIRPEAETFRKSGSWSQFHSDSAIVERDGARYIAVALAKNPKGGSWLVDLIVAMDLVVR